MKSKFHLIESKKMPLPGLNTYNIFLTNMNYHKTAFIDPNHQRMANKYLFDNTNYTHIIIELKVENRNSKHHNAKLYSYSFILSDAHF